MDGLMEPKTVEYLNYLRGSSSYLVVYNTQQIKLDYSYQVQLFADSHINRVAKQMLTRILLGKNIYGMVTSKKMGKFIIDYIRDYCKRHALDPIRMIFYQGDDLEFVEIVDDDGNLEETTQQQAKKLHFSDVNKHWK